MKIPKTYLFSLAIVFIFFLSACEDKADVRKEELETLKTEVFAVHDQVMPETMNTVPALRDSLKKYMVNVAATRTDSLKKVISKLDSAESGMDSWMKHYDSDIMEKEIPLEEKIDYMKKQKEILINVQKKTIEGIQQANIMIMISKSKPSSTFIIHKK